MKINYSKAYIFISIAYYIHMRSEKKNNVSYSGDYKKEIDCMNSPLPMKRLTIPSIYEQGGSNHKYSPDCFSL